MWSVVEINKISCKCVYEGRRQGKEDKFLLFKIKFPQLGSALYIFPAFHLFKGLENFIFHPLLLLLFVNAGCLPCWILKWSVLCHGPIWNHVLTFSAQSRTFQEIQYKIENFLLMILGEINLLAGICAFGSSLSLNGLSRGRKTDYTHIFPCYV